MAKAGEVGVLRGKATEMSVHLGSAILDAVFLGLWAAPNVGVERVITRLNVAGIDLVILRCMQALFGISTLAPICIWIYKDIRIMWLRANHAVDSASVVLPPPPPHPLSPAPAVAAVPKDGA